MRKAVITVTDALLVALLVAAIICALVLWRRRATKGSTCCGSYEQAPKRIGPKDRDKSHYPFETRLEIAGMTCERCAIRVENALNELPGTWASVRIADHTALVRTMAEPDIEAMRDAVAKAGYAVV